MSGESLNAAPPTPHPNGENPPRGWVCFDGDCGVCRALAERYRPFLLRRGFGLIALQDPWVRSHFSMSDEEYLRDIRLVRSDGYRQAGARVYLEVLRSVPALVPLALVLGLPGFYHAISWCYRPFADNRQRFSRACGIGSKPSD
ncbi:MAG: DUF393 domain-containing protein [Deltaproteobacteria bacterium]|nr:DUF393 domain-containing protein [Deltaproteobacteria bacterium]